MDTDWTYIPDFQSTETVSRFTTDQPAPVRSGSSADPTMSNHISEQSNLDVIADSRSPGQPEASSDDEAMS